MDLWFQVGDGTTSTSKFGAGCCATKNISKWRHFTSSALARPTLQEQFHCFNAFPVSGSPHDSSTLGVWTGFRKESFFRPENCILDTKPQRGCPQYLRDNLLRVSSPLISLRSICRACKSTSQRKLESWHAGSSLYVPLIYISFDQFAVDLPCLQKHLSAQT